MFHLDKDFSNNLHNLNYKRILCLKNIINYIIIPNLVLIQDHLHYTYLMNTYTNKFSYKLYNHQQVILVPIVLLYIVFQRLNKTKYEISFDKYDKIKNKLVAFACFALIKQRCVQWQGATHSSFASLHA